jgi:hypothetical protein
MARRQKISQMTPKGANLQATDLLEISELSGTGYITKSITGQQIINAGGGGGSQNLQQVTDIGATTTNTIITTNSFGAFDDISSPDNYSLLNPYYLELGTNSTGEQLFLSSYDIQLIKGSTAVGKLKATNVTNNVTLEFPNKTTGSYTIATTADIPSVSGFVPYTGATANVNLGTFHLDAGKGTFTHNGSTDTLTANHTSGSGIGLSITKGGANEGLKVNKTSGSGNAATIIGTLEATTLVKTGGTSSQFLMADGSTNTNVVPTSRTLNGFDLSADRTFTTANIADSVNKRYVTDANLTVLSNTSNTNTGDETQASILSKLGFFHLDFTPSSVVTGTTSETQVGVIMIPANTIKTTDLIQIFTPLVKVGSSGTCTVLYKLSTSSTMPSGTTDRIATFVSAAANLWLPMQRNIPFSGGNLVLPFLSTSFLSDFVVSNNVPTLVAINRTVDLYLYVSVQLSNAAESVYLAGGHVTNM